MTDLLDQLREANPVDSDTVEVSPQLAARILRAAPARPHWSQRLRLAPAVVGVAASVCLVILLAPGGRGGSPSLAARAYAATTGGGIIHWRTEQHNFSNGNDIEHLRSEGWSRNGVTHVVRYAMRRGKARLIDDTRTAEGRSRIYLASSDDYLSTPGTTGSSARANSANPLDGGDPFAIFRRAFRSGKLTKLGAQRYAVDLPGNANNGISAIYDLDPRTALPKSFTLAGTVSNGAKRYDNRLVMRFVTYERLAFTQANRVKLRLLAHPGAGPKNDPAASHFAVLRGDRRPGPAAMRFITRLAHQERYSLDADGARALGSRHYLVPGHGYVCLAVAELAGGGASCAAIAHAVKHGISLGTPAAGITVVVPDGVKALRARERGGRSETVAVHKNSARLPFGAYRWEFVR
jgi:hypothetical protein